MSPDPDLYGKAVKKMWHPIVGPHDDDPNC